MSVLPGKLERILVVNVNWLGDVIFSIPVFHALRENYPKARISCLAVPRVKEILQCIPQIDDIIVYDEKGKDRSIFGKMRIVRHVRQQHFDAVFLLHGSWSRAFLMFLSGIPIRIGYIGNKRGKFLTHPVAGLNEDAHKADIYFHLVKSVGLNTSDRLSRLQVHPDAKEQVKEILCHAGIVPGETFVVVHTSGNWDLKRWPQENWAQLIAVLMRDLKVKVVISEGPKEVQWANHIARLSAVSPVVLAGQTNLLQLMALLEKAAVVISADSGPLHIASCVSKNIVGIYGPTVPLTTGPRGNAFACMLHKNVGCNCWACYYLACPENICMKAVTVDEVVKAVKQLL